MELWTFGDAADDIDSLSPVHGNLASTMEVVLEGSFWDERVHEETLGACFGAAESQELDEIFMLGLHQSFDRILKVLLSE